MFRKSQIIHKFHLKKRMENKLHWHSHVKLVLELLPVVFFSLAKDKMELASVEWT